MLRVQRHLQKPRLYILMLGCNAVITSTKVVIVNTGTNDINFRDSMSPQESCRWWMFW